ncbi:long-chain-fatty-acid--CoA ligase [Cupriavidus gilardii]|uniref:long-chain-fatty-acid--CoA ligase n=1 Tax=Cupriavidus gilardii TaxID=82541 RepID=UPI001572EB6D|nr:long-chain-fatty-acid--CoA ligase [Cupriavidus gilardii]NSX05689.1 AMP-binding protein [Cupriavidus gilardii]
MTSDAVSSEAMPSNHPDQHAWFGSWPRGLPHRIHVPHVTLCHNLSVQADRYPDKPAIVFYGRALSYSELRRQTEALAGHLYRHGHVRPGERVLLMSQNCPQFVVAFHAIVRCGAVVVPVNAMCTANELDHYLRDSGAQVALVAQELLPALRPALADDRLRHRLRHVVVHNYADAIDADTDLDVPDWVRAPRAALDDARLTYWGDALAAALPAPDVRTSPDDLCVLPYTSGTTGHPKGCMHTHRTLLASTFSAVLWRGLHAEAVVMGVAPLFHLLGMQNAMLMPIAIGATVVMLPRWDAATAARLIERYRVTTWGAPPAMLIDFFAHPEASVRDLSSLTLLNGGGAAMPEAVAAMLKSRFGLGYIEGYGMTETASFLHCNPLHRPKRQCLGIPAFGVDSRIVDPATLAPLPPGEVGELVTSGDQLMLGYWNDEAANRESFFERDGKRFFRTGDLAGVDEEGYFFMRDRLKRMINVSGYKVWPAEVETMLYQHPAIHEACIVAVPDRRRGESVKAVVVLKPGTTLEAAALIAWCRERMAAYKAPRAVEFRTALPKSGTGKVLWREIQAQQRAAADEADAAGLGEIDAGSVDKPLQQA